MAAQKIRVVAVDTHPVQYRAPLWRRLAREADFSLEVLYGSDFSTRGYVDREFGARFAWDTPLLEGYPCRFLPGADRVDHVSWVQPRGLPVFRAVCGARPEVLILSAYLGSFWMGARLAADLSGCPVVLRHEASDEAHATGVLRAGLKKILLHWMYHGKTHFAFIGENARKHLEAHGIPPARLHFSPYGVDSEEVEAQRRSWLPRRDELRRELGAGTGDRVLVFSGKLIPKKDPRLMVEAVARLARKDRERIHLVVMGDGELKAELCSAASQLLGRRFHFRGFVNQSRMGETYAAADLLILPSRRGGGETWGLVVNEALQWGVPAAVSDGVGCRQDLVEPGRTGWIFPAGDAAALASVIQTALAKDETGRQTMQTSCREKIAAYSMEQAVAGLAQAVRAARRQGAAFPAGANTPGRTQTAP